MMANRSGSVVQVIVLGVTVLGSCTDPRAEAPTRTRLARIEGYMQMAGAREDEAPQRLAAVSDLIERQTRRREARLRRDLDRLEEWSRRDIERWYERQPRYRADLEDMWDGNPELAYEVIPRMFY